MDRLRQGERDRQIDRQGEKQVLSGSYLLDGTVTSSTLGRRNHRIPEFPVSPRALCELHHTTLAFISVT